MAEGSDAITGKFDFYDVLGYLIPGLVLLGLLSLPFGLFKGIWPSTNVTTAILYLVSAHIIGHLLHGYLRTWEKVPQIRDSKGKLRFPSSVVLDADQKFPAAIRDKIGNLVEKFWKIPSDDLLFENHDSDRNAAFLQARNLLLQSKRQSYFEQFQGKYALLGGMTAGLLLASAYYFGWAVSLISPAIVLWFEYALFILAALLLLLVIYLMVVQRFDSKIRFLPVLLILCVALEAGFLVANASFQPAETHKEVCPACAVCCSASSSEGSSEGRVSPGLRIEHKATFMFIMGLAALGAALRCYGGYKAFAEEFATGVWRDFANFDIVAAGSAKE